MPTDNDNEGPGLGLGDLNDIFNDDPFSNAGAESPTGNFIISSWWDGLIRKTSS